MRQLVSYFRSVKVWSTIQVRYEPSNLQDAERHGFDQFHYCTPVRFYRHLPNSDGIIPKYEQKFQYLADVLKQHNAKFIRGKSGSVLTEINQLVLEGVKYAPLASSGYERLPDYLERKRQ